MSSPEVDDVITLCVTHLTSTNSRNSEIESFLTRFLLIHLSGEYDKELKQLLVQRAKKTGDDEVISFVENTVSRIRNVQVSDISGILNRFSKDYAENFNKLVRQTELESRFDNIVTNRNKSAHGSSINMTLDELIESHKQAKEVLKAVSQTIS